MMYYQAWQRKENIMMNLTNYTVKEFAELINENEDTILDLMANNRHLGYVNKPYEGVEQVVEKSTIKDENKKIVTDYIYTNLFNRYEHRFYDKKGYSTVSN